VPSIAGPSPGDAVLALGGAEDALDAAGAGRPGELIGVREYRPG
jgi:hypothetical protein